MEISVTYRIEPDTSVLDNQILHCLTVYSIESAEVVYSGL